MLQYGLQEILAVALAAVVIDWVIGDPQWKWLTHPVVWIGRLIRLLERGLYRTPGEVGGDSLTLRLRGLMLTLITIAAAYGAVWAVCRAAESIHPWLGYAASGWFISTTIAVKGLKDAAMLVYRPLCTGNLEEARKYVGYIVGRDTTRLEEPEITRATVETVAENIVDAFISPLVFALLGGAPLAMLYRASNTLDSMVGYKNDKYLHFGWASARWDDVLNWLPARLTGGLLVAAAGLTPGLSAARAAKAVRVFARLHPSPNSGIPESAVAGALGIELGGVNVYHGRTSERARMGWPLRTRERGDILRTVGLLYKVSYLAAGGLLCVLLGIT
ncbi:adenosylcobinamide-phosphate synthase CbiB [Paenibacillus mucilaginosus]|uniref:Cobalamin biosynthesis protein CobD n=1 Tax=Paenibacillus mucilaginosus (strain KNP414) TaxID=1036673 RepID=F8FEJ4_PAEMK|nr:adenosylcobinamide-phosphate synthase CbiB [Paenibacillus mucilaginosus]AEI45311.1 cobalamin biosynthesis protein CobD [Paenibacillus mucilaginosus KNP414]MCG7212806.1 adenosylcobinamide-phosphate synthase CbiB [Paenibacillus mucilaginosus]WDM26769.1 cobalamin biosynthesis protein CobD [Paenibacillus mucilaginosus]